MTIPCSEIRVALSKGGRLQFVVHVPGLQPGEPIRGLEVDLEGPDSSTLSRFAQPREGGSFTQTLPRNGEAFTHVRLLRPGRYQISFRLDGHKQNRTAAVVRGGEAVRVETFLQK